MARAGVLAEAHVGDDQQIRGPLLDLADRLLHGSILRPGLRTLLILLVRQAKQEHRGNAQRAISAASSAIKSGEKWKQSVIEEIGFLSPSPARMKSG